MSKLRETEDLLEAVQTEKGNSEAQVTNVQGNQVFNGY